MLILENNNALKKEKLSGVYNKKKTKCGFSPFQQNVFLCDETFPPLTDNLNPTSESY